jgi:sugar lactone lactonase YvrE
VADRNNLKLQSCDDLGDCFWIGGDAAFGTRNQPGTFDLPHGVSVSADGSINIADEDNHMLQVCDKRGNCDASGGSFSEDTACSPSLGKWCALQDTAVDSLGRIYGMDTGNNRVQILRGGDLVTLDVFMRPGSALGQINNARGIAIDKNDRVIIADTGNNRIQICDLDENCTAFGSMGSALGQFIAPVGVDVDELGRIWVADTGNHRIQVCDYEGSCVAFGEFGTGESQFDQPHDVTVHSSGRVAVVDTGNNRIQLFITEASFQMNPGLNDAWYDPETDGQGFFVTVFPDLNLVLLAWFTYDTELPPMDAQAKLGDAGHRWLTAVGEINGNRSVMSIETTSGGKFDQPSEIDRATDGTIILSFDSCKSGLVEYDIPSINQQGTVPIQRVANDNIALCEGL